MYTEKCRQCPREFTKRTAGKAKLAARMHEGRAHGGMQRGNHIHAHSNGSANGNGVAVARKKPGRKPKAEERKKPGPKPGRKAERADLKSSRAEIMRSVEERLELADAAEDMRFCPRCGFAHHIALKAVVLARRHEHNR